MTPRAKDMSTRFPSRFLMVCVYGVVAVILSCGPWCGWALFWKYNAGKNGSSRGPCMNSYLLFLCEYCRRGRRVKLRHVSVSTSLPYLTVAFWDVGKRVMGEPSHTRGKRNDCNQGSSLMSDLALRHLSSRMPPYRRVHKE